MAAQKVFLRASLAATISLAMMGVAIAQGMGTGMMQGGTGSGMMGSQNAQSSPRSGAAQGPMCSGSCPCMQNGGTSGMMDSGRMHHGRMHERMMRDGMGAGMMGMMHGGGMASGMMGSGAGSMDTLFGSRVVPTLNISIDDVRTYLNARLDRLNNKRLKLGDLKSDDAVITADVVTVDNSLVQRLIVDRHTGEIQYEN